MNGLSRMVAMVHSQYAVNAGGRSANTLSTALMWEEQSSNASIEVSVAAVAAIDAPRNVQ